MRELGEEDPVKGIFSLDKRDPTIYSPSPAGDICDSQVLPPAQLDGWM